MRKKSYKQREIEVYLCPYSGEIRQLDWGIGKYEHLYCYQWRQVRTFSEIRQHYHALDDGQKVRRRRLLIPTVWDDRTISRNWGRSWKDYTKRRKQWDK